MFNQFNRKRIMRLENVKALRERLITAIYSISANQTTFARQYGFDSSNFSKKINGAKPFTTNDLVKLNKTPINVEWLRTGEGKMIKDGYIPGPSKQCIVSKGEGIPLFDVDYGLGYVDFYNDETITPVAYVDFPGTKGATCWVRTTGDSMEPIIHSGDYICLKRIDEWNIFLNFGEIYAIETSNDMRSIKKICKGSDDEHITLIPENPSYERQEIRKDIVRSVFKVMAISKLL